MERKWDSRLDAIGVRLEAPANAKYRLVEAWWRGPEESRDKHHIYVRILDEAGAPLEGQPFRITNGGVFIERTKGKGFDDFYGNFPMFAGGGYAVDVPDATSDKITGLATGLPGKPFANTSIILVFRRGADVPAPQPPTPQPPEPQPPIPVPQPPAPEPPAPPQPAPGPKLDEATRGQLLALLDKAQAELDAARKLLEV